MGPCGSVVAMDTGVADFQCHLY